MQYINKQTFDMVHQSTVVATEFFWRDFLRARTIVKKLSLQLI